MAAESTPPPPVNVGALIADKYRIVKLLAQGGMGSVFEAKHDDLGQRVAVKMLHRELVTRKDFVERFLREARIAARIRNEHVVRVFDVGTHDGVPYMVMEYLQGTDLADLIETSGKQPLKDAVDYILQALAALIDAHEDGVVHRDLKPANLFIEQRSGRAHKIKVLDFGISKIAPGEDVNASITATRSLLGSPGYMSPEQIISTRNVDARSDVWSLGAILYELISGEPAFAGETIGEIFANIRERDLPPIRSRREDVPEALERVLVKALKRERDERYASARDFRNALMPFASIRARTLLMSDRPPPHPVGSADDGGATDLPALFDDEEGAAAYGDTRPSLDSIDMLRALEAQESPPPSLRSKTQETFSSSLRPKGGRNVVFAAATIALGILVLGFIAYDTLRETSLATDTPSEPATDTPPEPATTTPPVRVTTTAPEPSASSTATPPPKAAPKSQPPKSQPAKSQPPKSQPPKAPPPKPQPPPPPQPKKTWDDLGI
jgi:serine/threonine-protein kinase